MSFLSLEFLALAATAVVALTLLRGAWRALAFLALNGWFAWTYLGASGSVSTAAFLLAGYALVVLSARRPAWRGAMVALYVAAFVYMRRYSFLDLALPESWLSDALATAGLSFLLFKVLSLAFDVAGGRERQPGPLDFLNYCLNFTTFLMGPIQRFGEFRAQWNGEHPLEPRFEAYLNALNRVLRGLVKKFVAAEAIRHLTLLAVPDVTALPGGELLWRTYVFYLYLYLDFSGYCDIVVGVGSLMGVRPPENFNLPFLSGNVADFWLRVHRTLTTWLTDYVFNPLFMGLLRTQRMGRRPLASTSLALLGTMLVSGLWHGTTLSFVLFGMVHGLYLVVFRVYEHNLTRRLGTKRARAWRQSRTSRVLGVLLTYNVTSLAYLFFVVDSDTVLALARRFLLP